MRVAFEKCFPFGSLVRLVAVFSGPVGSPPEDGNIDPDTVTVRTKDPSNSKVAYVYLVAPSVIRDAQGEYHCDIDASLSGEWFYRWEGTGSAQAAREGRFTVADSVFQGSP